MRGSYFQVVSQFLASAQRQVTIVSAFIRSDTLESLLANVKKGVSIDIYARWRIADLVAGASDIGVINLAKQKGANFKVLDTLHAKIYIADDNALVGSANATNAGLGRLSHGGNLEILLKAPTDSHEIQKVIDTLHQKAFPPQNYTNEILTQLRQIDIPLPQENITDFQDNWLPVSLPIDILHVSQQTGNALTHKALKDCYVLGIAPGVDKNRLREMAMTRRIFAILSDALANDYHGALSDEKIASILTEFFLVDTKEAAEKWNILKIWIEYLSQDMYISPVTDTSFELRRGQKISSAQI